jgi:hypothetical protein
VDEDEPASRQVAGLIMALDLVGQAARDAVEHGHGELAAAREWLAARLAALPRDDPTVAACSLVAWSDVFDLFVEGPRGRYLPRAADPAGLDRAQLGDLVARRAEYSAAEHVAVAIAEAEASREISPKWACRRRGERPEDERAPGGAIVRGYAEEPSSCEHRRTPASYRRPAAGPPLTRRLSSRG